LTEFLLNRELLATSGFHNAEEENSDWFLQFYRLCSTAYQPTRCRGGAMRSFRVVLLTAAIIVSSSCSFGQVGKTEITKWQYGKSGAVSLTYDDGSINQFRVAVPIMDNFGFPATFFIITGEIRGSRYEGTFVGRPTKAIIAETASVTTNKENFFERASAIGFLGYKGTLEYHTRAGELYDENKNAEQAYRVLDEGYEKVRKGAFPPADAHGHSSESGNHISWDDLRALAQRGYEFASHTVTHPRMAVLDDANLVYELEMSRREILDQLGFKHTFSVECPYGTENDRALRAALLRYELARNYMPDSDVDDLDRANDMNPATSRKQYVRWQRGPLTETPMDLMKSWVDKTASQGNVWLVLVFHGVDGIGWKPKTGAELKTYFAYIDSKKQSLWVATFQDVAKYIREREHGAVTSYQDGEGISVVLRSDLTDVSYDLPLTLKTYVPDLWKTAEIRQGERTKQVDTVRVDGANYVVYQALPNAEVVTLARIEQKR
jgi:peptidoglycan/xylan/chitin deacetylase (PgdA/CDA1 family)